VSGVETEGEQRTAAFRDRARVAQSVALRPRASSALGPRARAYISALGVSSIRWSALAAHKNEQRVVRRAWNEATSRNLTPGASEHVATPTKWRRQAGGGSRQSAMASRRWLQAERNNEQVAAPSRADSQGAGPQGSHAEQTVIRLAMLGRRS
jgi:hypothetical protein